MNAKHTPGPWEAEQPEKFAPEDVERPWVGRLSENRFSALACGETAKEAQANAHRIVACVNACEGIADPSVVPELLEAAEGLASDAQCLVDCRADCGEWGVECPLQDAHKPDGTIERLQRLWDVIAKARGEA